jgi:hypothetical protein
MMNCRRPCLSVSLFCTYTQGNSKKEEEELYFYNCVITLFSIS